MIWSDLGSSARTFARNPAFAGALVLTIALGVGTNAAVSGFVRGFTQGDASLPESHQLLSAAMLRIGMLLTLAAWAVFIVACINVATLLLSRSSSRSHESSVRIALGASRGQIARQLLADAIVVSLAGAAVGMLLASWTIQLVPSLLFEQDAERLVFVAHPSATISASIACAIIMIGCGLAPLIEIRHDDCARVLRRESAGTSPRLRRLRTGLVIVQMTCCCVLVISAAALITSFRSALRTETGRHLQHAILATVESQARFTRPDLGLEYFRDIEQAAQSMPQTVTTAWSGVPPGSRPAVRSVRTVPPHQPLRDVVLDLALFTRQSLDTVTLPPIAGRMFGAGDTPRSCLVVVINDAARDLLGGDVVGETIQSFGGQRAVIVGVVAARGTARKGILPTVYYYPDQGSGSGDLIGANRFRVPAGVPRSSAVLETHVVSPSYFDLMGVTVLSGTVFANAPTRRCRVGLVNEQASERYFAGNPIGGAVIDGAGHATEIVGLVRSPLVRASQRQTEPAIYLPMTQDFLPRMTLIIGSRDASDDTLAALRRRLDAIPGGRSPAAVTTLEDHLSRVALAPERIAMVLVSASAAMALLLGGLGLSGAMFEAARQRRREFGVRIALGSQGWRLVGQVLREGARLAASGTIAGLLVSRLVSRWLSQIAPATDPPPLWIWLAAPAALLVAVAIASVLPARMALATDPLTIMRDE